MSEIRPVPWCPNKYAISEDGVVFSLLNTRGRPLPEPKKLTLEIKPDGVVSVQLRIDGRNKQTLVHHLVAEAFIDRREGRRVTHIDGNLSNNKASNLAYLPSIKRFESTYTKDERSGCWIWNSYKNPSGYGQTSYNKLAHRISYEIHRGPIPKGMLVWHSCDIPSCVNPDHLFVGSTQDNMDDKVSKGRQVKGEHTSKAKLTEKQVKAIRRSKLTAAALGMKYGVTDVAICYVRLRKTWKHVP